MKCLREFATLVILWWFCAPVDCFHTSFCFRFPKDKVLTDASYGVSGDPDVSSPGIEKFPSDIWEKYAWTFDGNKQDDTGQAPKTINFGAPDQTGELELIVKPILGRPGFPEPLIGWFRVQVSLTAQNAFSEYIRSFILFATDDQGNFVGTWEYDAFPDDVGEDADCPASQATKHMIIPCGAVSKYEATASNVVLYVRNNSRKPEVWPQEYKEDWPIVPEFKEEYELNFYYKFNQQSYNKNNGKLGSRLHFRVLADPDHTYIHIPEGEILDGPEVEKKLLANAAFFIMEEGAIVGGADPLPTDRSTLSCSNTLKSRDARYPDRKGEHWPWYVGTFFPNSEEHASSDINIKQTLIDTLPIVPAYYMLIKTGCTAKFYGGRCNSTYCSLTAKNLLFDSTTKRGMADFSLIPQVKSAKTGGTCQCGTNRVTRGYCYNEAPEVPTKFNSKTTTFPNCLDYYRELAKGDRCNKTVGEIGKIRVIRRQPVNLTKIRYENQSIETQKKKIAGLKQLNTKHAIDIRGVRMYGVGTLLYGVRKGHGIMMLAMTLFCLPISIFVSRYFKESFMSKRILYARIWFQIHIQLVFLMCAFALAGILLALVGRGFLGVSLHPYGLMHRVFGWATFALFLVVAPTGGIRLYADPGRKITIITHWALGYLFYIFAMLSVISSMHVPGSPIAYRDKSVDDRNLHGQTYHENIMYIIITFWILFELVMHVTMNFFLHSYDRWMNVEEPRLYFPPFIGVPIPVLRENSEQDASGAGLRLITFWIYIGTSILVAALACLMLVNNKPNVDKGLGPMSCTHEWNESLSDELYHGVKYQFRKAVDPTCFY